MSKRVLVEIEMSTDMEQFKLPKGVNQRLQELLDRQELGEELTAAERMEAEGLVNVAELLSLLRLRAQRVSEDNMTYYDDDQEDARTEANNKGQADRARYEEDLANDPTGLETALRQLILDDYYDPPDDPDLQDAYDAGFHNR